MQVNYRSFPHPVLAPFLDDLVECDFQCSIAPRREGHQHNFEVKARVSNHRLEASMRAGLCSYAVHLECPATRYRNIWKFSEDQFSFKVDNDQLDGRVEVSCFILAAQDMVSYTNEAFHEDYEGASFSIREGDILAVDESKKFFLEREQDPLRYIPSIFTITWNAMEEPPAMDVDTTGDKIVVKLRPDAYQKYLVLKQDLALRPLLNSLLVIPALVCVLGDIYRATLSNTDVLDEYQDKRWFRVLYKRLAEMNISLSSETEFDDSSLNLASRLVGDSLPEGIEALERLATSEE